MITITPNEAKHQQIIFDVCKRNGIKSLQLTDMHIKLMDECIEEFRKLKVGDEIAIIYEYKSAESDKRWNSARVGKITRLPADEPKYYLELDGSGVQLDTELYSTKIFKLC